MTADEADSLAGRIARVLDEVRDDLCGFDAEEMSAAVLPIVAEEVRTAKAEALREAARYFAGGLHCADMRATPEETVRDLNRRATEYETGDQR